MAAIPLSSARILLIISGGIAAYKSLELIRRLRDCGAAVQVVMTSAARQFISPLSAATLSGQPVRDDLFSLTDEATIGHIELSRAADLRERLQKNKNVSVNPFGISNKLTSLNGPMTPDAPRAIGGRPKSISKSPFQIGPKIASSRVPSAPPRVAAAPKKVRD